jgi:hypothetical protein
MAEHVRCEFRIGQFYGVPSEISQPGLEPFKLGHQPVFSPGYFHTSESVVGTIEGSETQMPCFRDPASCL